MADQLDARHAAALETLLDSVPDVDWALTGSTGFALRGVPVAPSDVDVRTDEPGGRSIGAAVPDRVIGPVRYVESERSRSARGGGPRRRDNRGPAEATR